MTSAVHSIEAARAALGISYAEEKRIARELSPAIAWPTLALAIFLPSTFAAFVALGLTHALPQWVCTVMLMPVSYAHYTLVHEAIHGNVVSKPRRLAWINTLVGFVGSLGLGEAWPALQRTHYLHHSHTNTELDPDIEVKGPLAQLLGMLARALPFSFLPLNVLRHTGPKRYKELAVILNPAEIAHCSGMALFQLAVPLAALATGHFTDWLMLWFLPTRVAILALKIMFSWLPHYPFDRTERYHNTRISLWSGASLLTLQQNLHLMHHLWPSVPFYNYARLFGALRPVLLAEGSAIQGLAVGPWVRTIAA